MKRQQDVSIGHATIPVHADGGWALPGGKRTGSHAKALEACERFDAILHAQIGKTKAAGIPFKNVKPVITRRRVSGLDAERHTVSA